MAQLPSELLIDIFSLASANSAHRIVQKLHLAQVCAYWRAVALEYPTFWAQNWVRTPRDASCLPVALAYSGGCALDVEIDTSGRLSGANELAVVHALMLPKQRLRLKRLIVTTGGYQLLVVLEAGLEFPVLEDLAFDGYYGTPPHILLRLDAPRLRKLALNGMVIRSCHFPITPLLEQLQLDMFSADPYDAARLLSTILCRCTALRHLDWNVATLGLIPAESDAMQEPLVPHLTTLRLGYNFTLTSMSNVMRFVNLYRTAVDPIHDVAVRVQYRGGLVQDDDAAQLLEDVFYRTGSLVDLRVESSGNNLGVVIRDDVGRVRRLTFLSDGWHWNIKQLWSVLTSRYNIDKSLRSLRMRTMEWTIFGNEFRTRPPTALTEVHVVLEGDIQYRFNHETLAPDLTVDSYAVPQSPRILNLPNIRKVVIVKDDRDTSSQYEPPLVTRVREILQHVECGGDASNQVEVCVLDAEVPHGEELPQALQETLLDGLADKWGLCCHCKGV